MTTQERRIDMTWDMIVDLDKKVWETEQRLVLLKEQRANALAFVQEEERLYLVDRKNNGLTN